jgi:hypothetical protein
VRWNGQRKKYLLACGRLAQRGRAFPSHGRGRRFNPYSAQALIGSVRQLPAERYGNTRSASVQNRCNPFTERSSVFQSRLEEVARLIGGH